MPKFKGIICFPIEAAVVFADIKIIKDTGDDDTTYCFPEPNTEYKMGGIFDGVLMASKDKKIFVLAISVRIQGKFYTKQTIKEIIPEEAIEMLVEKEETR